MDNHMEKELQQIFTKNDLKIVGKAVRRIDAIHKVTGTARYAADYYVPGMLYAKVFRSDRIHAIIKKIDTSDALRLPGVVAVVTGRDLPNKAPFGYIYPDEWILPIEKVRYYGEGIAAVAATSKEAAERALDFIKVEYEDLPAVFDPEEAMKEGAPQVGAKKRNLMNELHTKKGDVEKGFDESDAVVEHEFRTQRIEHSYLEPEAAVAIPEGDTLTIITNSQYPFFARYALAHSLNIPLNKLRLITPPLGGSFGGKDSSAIWCTGKAALLALKTGKPVKLVYTREESMIESNKRHPFIMRYKVGATNDGKLLALKALNIADGGAYPSSSAVVLFRAHVHSTGPYEFPNVQVDSYVVYTNNVLAGAMRGFGTPQVNFAIDSILEILATKLDMDPVDLKMKNLVKNRSTLLTGQILDGHVVSSRQLLKRAIELSEYKKKRELYKQDKGRYRRGIGIANSIRGVSFGGEGFDYANGIITVHEDGSVAIATGIIDGGQGAKTVLSQIVAEVFGIPYDYVYYLDSDTGVVPNPLTTSASRGTVMGGHALSRAAIKIKSRMTKVAAEVLKTKEENIVFEDGVVFDRTDKSKRISFKDLALLCHQRAEVMTESGWYSAPPLTWNPETGTGSVYFTFSYTTNVAEVEVDTETGNVKVLRIYALHDSGRIVNPKTARSQVYGGLSWAIGFALFEDFKLKNGIPQQINFDKYKILRAIDAPDIFIEFIENPDPNCPFGAKSLAEPALEIGGPAIIDAIYNAIGKRVDSLPATPEKILRLLKE